MNKNKILIVDDINENLALLCELLQDEGYKTFSANSGELALASLKKNIPDLILLDIRMPGMSGFDVCKQIKQNKKLTKIPIIFLSSVTEINEKLEGFRLGAVDYITKPFHKEELLVRVKTHISIRQKEFELKETNNELIIAKKKAEESEAQIKLITDNIPVIISRISNDLKYLFVNEQYHTLFGKHTSEIIGKPLLEILGKATYERGIPYYNEVLSGKSVSYENSVINKNGELINFQTNYIPEIKDNQVIGFYFFAYDITERKKAEINLKLYKKITNSASEHMAFIDTDYIYRAVNNSYLNAHKKSRKQIIGYSIPELLGNEIFESFVKEKIDSCFSGENIKYQDWFDFEEIGKRYMDVSYYPYFDNNNNITGLIVDSYDITEWKKSEQELQKHNNEYASLNEEYKTQKDELIKEKEKAEASEHKLNEILNYISDGIYIHSSDHIIEYQNVPMTKMLGSNKIGEKCYKALFNRDKKCE